MAVWIDLMRAATALNVVLLLVLTGIWARNYAAFRSKHTLGLAIFGALLLVENLMALYYYLWHPMLHAWFADLPGPAAEAIALLRVLQSAALLFLAWITWD
jgi:hypothetical protein